MHGIYLPCEEFAISVCGLGVLHGANETCQARGIYVADGDEFEIIGMKTGDVESGVFCLQWILFRGS